jgi:rhodanese-related sulfurtransferase
MPSTVYTPNEVRRLLQDGAQLLDVLAADEFEHDHLPDAINIPLKQLDATSAALLDRNRPVVVYCNDFG